MRPSLFVLVLAAFAAFFVGAVGAVGSRGQGQQPALDLGSYPTGQVSGPPVEQWSWWTSSGRIDPDHTVVNPYLDGSGPRVTWDINEHSTAGASGTIAPGVSVTSPGARVIWDPDPIYSCRPMCALWSGPHHKFGTYATASTGGLDIQTCFHPQERCFASGVSYDSGRRLFVYRFCGQVVYRDDDPAVGEIAGSALAPNTVPGRGVLSDVSVSVSSSLPKLVKSVSVRWGFSSDVWAEAGCSASGLTGSPPLDLPLRDYPFLWGVS